MHSYNSCALALVVVLATACHPDTATSAHPPAQAPKYAGLAATSFDSVQLRTRQIPALGIELSLPDKWTFTQRTEQKQVIWSAREPCPKSVKFCANYVLNAAPRQAGVPPKSYGEFFLKSRQTKNATFTLLNSSEEQVSGMPSLTLDYIFLESGLNLGGTTTFYFLPEKVIVLNFVALNEPEGGYVRYRGIYTRSLATLKPLQ